MATRTAHYDASLDARTGRPIPPQKANRLNQERQEEEAQLTSAVRDLETEDKQKPVKSSESDEDAIRERAYQIWCEEGKPEGREQEHWHRARAEIEGDKS
jgi:hypothetical protein